MLCPYNLSPFWDEIFNDKLKCSTLFLRFIEKTLMKIIHQDKLNDDMIIEPYLAVAPMYIPGDLTKRWGVEIKHSEITAEGGSWGFMPALVEESDIDKLVGYDHKIDEKATAENFGKLQDAFGDVFKVVVSRAPIYKGGYGDIVADFARLRGLEQLMWDMVDRPEWVHRVCAFMRDAILRQHQQAEDAGHWTLIDGANQAMPYSRELPDPSADGKPAGRKQLWANIAAQELAQVSPAMHEEFALQYQLPIMEKFGLIAYGCCEDLTNKIDMLRKIPNLRRIAVTPFANVARCAEQIKTDYIMSWRPSPADMICTGFKPDKARNLIREGLQASKGCLVDLNLKDVQTIGGNFNDLIDCVNIMREEAENVA